MGAWHHDCNITCPKCDCLFTRELQAEECYCPDCEPEDEPSAIEKENEMLRAKVRQMQEKMEELAGWVKRGLGWRHDYQCNCGICLELRAVWAAGDAAKAELERGNR